jgi:4-hydroxy-tetrahydrodipicolinate synthase
MLEGHLCLSVTPFGSDGSLDLGSLRGLVRHLLEGGVEGVIILGSTGEFFSLTDEEREAAVRETVEAAGGTVPVIAGVGASGTEQAVRLTRQAVAAGADAVMVPPPFYAPGFFSSPPAIAEHLLQVAAAASPAEVMLYDGGGGVEIPLDVIAEVAASARNITAVKLTVPAPAKVAGIRAATHGRVGVLCGNDALTLYELALGVAGVAIGVGNVVPADVTSVVRGYREGEPDRARTRFYERVLPVASIALCATQQFIQVFKLALARMGVIASDRVREPLLPLDELRAEEAVAAFRFVGLPV